MKVVDLEEKRLESAAPEELSRHLMGLPVKRRLEVILNRVDAEQVVAALAEQDFFFSVKEIGPQESVPLLALATVGQLNHLFDLEWWRKDQVLPAKALDWLELLSRGAGEEKLLSWLYHVDFELLVVLFKKWIRVVTAPEDTDLLEVGEQLPPNTLDDQFFWEAHYPQYEDFIKSVLSCLYEVNYGFYKELMNHTMLLGEVEIEEEAYHFHRARLEDQAIPDFYDALDIYRNILPEQIIRAKGDSYVRPLQSPAPSFALALVPDGDFLRRVLQEIRDDTLMDMLQMELAALANKVIVADQLALESPEVLHHAADKAAAYVNLGLLLKSEGDLRIAAGILKEVFLEHLFRLGHSRVVLIKNRLLREKQEGWLSKWPASLKCLEPDWMESAELLLLKTPRLLRPSSDERFPPRDDLFRNQEDLARGNHIVDVIVSLGPLFDSLHARPEALYDRLWKEAQIGSLEDVTVGAMIWTAATWFQLEGRWEVKPLPAREWATVYPLVRPDRMESFIRAWVEDIVPDPTQLALANAYLNPLFHEYREEMAPFDDLNMLDPSLAKLFIFTAE